MQPPVRLLVLLAVAATFFTGTLLALQELGMAFMQPCTAPGAALQEYTGCFTWAQWGLSIGIIVGGFSFFAVCSAAVRSVAQLGSASSSCCERAMGWVALLVLLVANVCAALGSMVYLAKPDQTYQTTPEGITLNSSDWTIDNWQVFLGSGIFAAAAPMSVALLGVAVNLCPYCCGGVGGTAAAKGGGTSGSRPASSREIREVVGSSGPGGRRSTASSLPPDFTEDLLAGGGGGGGGDGGGSGARRRRRGGGGGGGVSSSVSAGVSNFLANAEISAAARRFPIGRVIGALVVLGVCYLATTVGSPIWNYSANSYFMSRSPYAWGFLAVGPERPCFLNKTCSCGDGFKECPWFSFHAYTDTFIYYAFLALAVVVAAVAHNLPCCACARKTVGGPTAPVSCPCFPRSLRCYTNGCSALEALALLAVAALYAFWLVYW